MRSIVFGICALITAGLALANAADGSAKDIYVTAAIGGVAVFGTLLIYGFYRLGKFAVLKYKPETSTWLQRVSGIAGVLAFFLFMAAFGK